LLSELKGDLKRHGGSLLEPGFVSLALYRYGRWVLGIRNPALRWFMSKFYGLGKHLILNVTRVCIPPQVQIGEDFHIIHPGFQMIHPDVVIGDRCGIMHNVTLGTNMGPGVPRIGDDVFIGCNTSILGAVKIGDRSRIGANTLVTTNVPPDSIAIGSPAKIYPQLGMRRAAAAQSAGAGGAPSGADIRNESAAS